MPTGALDSWLRGAIVGFSIAAPIGPIGLLCIRRTLADGLAVGLVSGLGAALADAMYGGIAGFGLTYLANLIISQTSWLRLIGGLFLCYLGLRIIILPPNRHVVRHHHGATLIGAFFSAFLLTLTNPMTILAYAAVFSSLGLGAGGSRETAAWLVLGVFCGSALWWLMLSEVVNRFRAQFDAAHMVWVNRISGALIAGFGLLALVRAFL